MTEYDDQIKANTRPIPTQNTPIAPQRDTEQELTPYSVKTTLIREESHGLLPKKNCCCWNQVSIESVKMSSAACCC